MQELENIKIHPKVDVKLNNSSVKNIETKLDALERNKVSIGAKLDSSFDSVMNTINRQTDTEKKIKITAEENVTRTTKNLQRDIFTMERSLKTSIFGNGRLNGNFNVSSPDWTNGFSTIVNAINSTASTNKTNSAGTGSSFIRDIASNSIGTNAAMAAAGVTVGRINKVVKASTVTVKGGNVSLGNSSNIKTGLSAASYDIKQMLHNYKNGYLDDTSPLRDFGIIGSKNKAWTDSSAFYELINTQKATIKEMKNAYNLSKGKVGSYKNKEYIPKYRNGSATILGSYDYNNGNAWNTKSGNHYVDGNLTYDFIVKDTKFGNAMSKIYDKYKNTIGNMKLSTTIFTNHMKQTMSTGINAVNNKFSWLRNKAKNLFDTIKFNSTLSFTKMKMAATRSSYGAYSALGKVGLAAVKLKDNLVRPFSAMGAKISQVTAKFGGLKGALAVVRGKASVLPSVFGKWAAPINLAGKAIRTGFIKPLNAAYSGVKKLAGKTWKMTINLAGNAFGMLSKMVAWAGTLAGGLVIKGVTDAATIEQYEVSMQHFISNGMKNTQPHLSNTQRESVAATETKNFLNTATKLANTTPFSTSEILEAANRSIGVANGDTEQAKTLLKLASDMASLTPGKTVMDAMEALADLKMGERERMKEFGFKIDNDEFVKAAGAKEGTNIADLTDEQMAKAYATLTEQGGAVFETFNGGAEKISKTFKGQFSTMLGLTGSTFSSMGRMILEPLSDPLSKVNEKLLKVSDGMTKLKDGVLSGDIPNPFTNWTDFADYAKDNQGTGNPIIDMAAKAAPAIDKMKVVFGKVKEFMAPIIDSVKNIAKSFMDFFTNPAIQGALETWGGLLGDVCQTAFDWLDKAFRFIADNAEPIGNFLNYIGQAFKFIFELISGVVETAWIIVEPILSLLMDWLGKIYRFLANSFSKAGDFVKGFFDTIKSPLESVIKLFEGVANAIGGALSKFGQWSKKTAGNIVGNISDFFGGDDYNKNGRAVGQAYVPYNGYKASLHKGEAILTAQEARAWREGRVGGGNSTTPSMSVNINVYESNNAKATANEIVRQLKRVASNMG